MSFVSYKSMIFVLVTIISLVNLGGALCWCEPAQDIPVAKPIATDEPGEKAAFCWCEQAQDVPVENSEEKAAFCWCEQAQDIPDHIDIAADESIRGGGSNEISAPDLTKDDILPYLNRKLINDCAFKGNQTLVNDSIRGYIKFLEDIKRNNINGQRPPNYFVDLVWHYHIIWTKKYFSFCKEYFGRFVHHVPGDRVPLPIA
eukprot:556550_1